MIRRRRRIGDREEILPNCQRQTKVQGGTDLLRRCLGRSSGLVSGPIILSREGANIRGG